MNAPTPTPTPAPAPAAANSEILDVAVIGAGPAGLLLARRLAASDARFAVLERNADVGGIWDIDAPGSPMYESAHFISSRTLSGFPGFPMPEHYPDYPNHKQLLAYIRSFAEAFDLRRHIRFGAQVESARCDAAGVWSLQLAGGTTVRARYLVCANGVTWEPNRVEWPGMAGFTGEIRHSVTYRSPKEFEGKRVLVIGCGNSGFALVEHTNKATQRQRGNHPIGAVAIFSTPKRWPKANREGQHPHSITTGNPVVTVFVNRH